MLGWWNGSGVAWVPAGRSLTSHHTLRAADGGPWTRRQRRTYMKRIVPPPPRGRPRLSGRAAGAAVGVAVGCHPPAPWGLTRGRPTKQTVLKQNRGVSKARLAAAMDGAVAASAATGVPAEAKVAWGLCERLRGVSGDTAGGPARRLWEAARQSLGRPSLGLLGPPSLPMPREVSALGGHQGRVFCPCTTRDAMGGEVLVSGAADGTVRVWDARRGQALAVCGGHSDWVRCLCAVGGGGRPRGGGGAAPLVVSGSEDTTLRVRDTERGGSGGGAGRPHGGDRLSVCGGEGRHWRRRRGGGSGSYPGGRTRPSECVGSGRWACGGGAAPPHGVGQLGLCGRGWRRDGRQRDGAPGSMSGSQGTPLRVLGCGAGAGRLR